MESMEVLPRSELATTLDVVFGDPLSPANRMVKRSTWPSTRNVRMIGRLEKHEEKWLVLWFFLFFSWAWISYSQICFVWSWQHKNPNNHNFKSNPPDPACDCSIVTSRMTGQQFNLRIHFNLSRSKSLRKRWNHLEIIVYQCFFHFVGQQLWAVFRGKVDRNEQQLVLLLLSDLGY